ncbi:hypothetical protein HMPREF1494_0102 [Bifidobacterium sp. MSTE12]|uniref:Uncharacterized protein n=1 Tax=Bifidobacterium dentium JCVIHMP022 TaxID=553191 RepID=A0AB72YYA9_9BIFI|nr:hypothetical protein HMPREF9003_0953 [Bifidobacterium dentium JCVIHMP022]ETO98372.1 hypothetical protein HMPREF1494_0102 [Bifidobacterium sp. MSTE12]
MAMKVRHLFMTAGAVYSWHRHGNGNRHGADNDMTKEHDG